MRNDLNIQRGNILFLILLAVVLFTALAYAVTSSMRGGGKDASGESLQAGVADMLNQFAAIDAALMRMQTTGGLRPDQISFESVARYYNGTTSTINNTNANCSTTSCRLFHPDGGGIADRSFEKYANPAPSGSPVLGPGYWQIYLVQWPQAGTAANDVVLQYVYASLPFCNKMRDALDLAGTASLGGTFVSASNPSNWDNTAYTITAGASTIAGQTTFVQNTMGTGTGQYCHINHLIFAR